MTPNVGGNRRADEMRTEDQAVYRRVLFTDRLALDPPNLTRSNVNEHLE